MRGWRYGNRKKEREGTKSSVFLCSCIQSSMAPLQHFTGLAVPETDPPLPPSLRLSSHLPPLPPVISPPLAPVIPPPAPLTAHPFFPPVPILSFLSFNFSSADPHPPLLILNVLFFSLQCNILSCFAFLLYTHPRSPCPVAGV